MDFHYYERHINRDTPGKYDTGAAFEDGEVFGNLIGDLSAPFEEVAFNKVVGIDASGLALGGAVALKLEKGFVPVRKGGSCPASESDVARVCFVDYTGKRKSLEMNRRSIRQGARFVIVDDWVETGAQVKAVITLIEEQGGVVAGVSVMCAEMNEGVKRLFEEYNCQSIGVIHP